MPKKRYRKTFVFDGKKYWASGSTEQEAIENRAVLRREMEEGKARITKNMLVRDWAGMYLETYRRPAVSDSTFKDNCSTVNVWIGPYLGNLQLKEVKLIHCQTVANAMSGYSKNRIKKVHWFMRKMFDTAMENGLMLSNPAARVALPKAEDGTRRAATDSERALLLRVCETNPYGLWALVMLCCGLRPGETARVLGNHVDLKKRVLFVDGTKTKAARRHVPIPGMLAEELARRGTRPFEYLFTNRDGKPLTKTNRRRMWESIVKDMNIAAGCRTSHGGQRVFPPFAVAGDLVPYCLRHTYCTDLEAAGVPINVAARFMGHTSIELTARIYTHASEAAFENARDLMDKVAGGVAKIRETV
jgi:integrase